MPLPTLRLSATALAAILPLAAGACASYGDPDPIADDPDPIVAECPDTRGFQAFVNAMPGPNDNPTLIVTGEAWLEQGIDAALRPVGPNTEDPARYRFDLEARAGSGIGGWTALRGEASRVAQSYDEVYVTCGGAVVARVTDVETAY